jgi:hypothetical protein
MPTCECGHDFDGIDFPYTDGVTCPECGRTWSTDWDYVAEDSRAWWLDRELTPPAPTEPPPPPDRPAP